VQGPPPRLLCQGRRGPYRPRRPHPPLRPVNARCPIEGCGTVDDHDSSDPALSGWSRLEVAALGDRPRWYCSDLCVFDALARAGHELTADDRRAGMTGGQRRPRRTPISAGSSCGASRVARGRRGRSTFVACCCGRARPGGGCRPTNRGTTSSPPRRDTGDRGRRRCHQRGAREARRRPLGRGPVRSSTGGYGLRPLQRAQATQDLRAVRAGERPRGEPARGGCAGPCCNGRSSPPR
jgi:hypothetical protein